MRCAWLNSSLHSHHNFNPCWKREEERRGEIGIEYIWIYSEYLKWKWNILYTLDWTISVNNKSIVNRTRVVWEFLYLSRCRIAFHSRSYNWYRRHDHWLWIFYFQFTLPLLKFTYFPFQWSNENLCFLGWNKRHLKKQNDYDINGIFIWIPWYFYRKFLLLPSSFKSRGHRYQQRRKNFSVFLPSFIHLYSHRSFYLDFSWKLRQISSLHQLMVMMIN
jgi:hypothetical protein